jgi:hypothetical protein
MHFFVLCLNIYMEHVVVGSTPTSYSRDSGSHLRPGD